MRRILATLAKSPLFLGGIMAGGWYSLILFGPLNHPSFRALFTDHPVEYATAILFFVGLGSLLLRAAKLGSQWRAIGHWSSWSSVFTDSGRIEERELINRLLSFADQWKESLLGRRLRELVRATTAFPSGQEIDDHLRLLAEKDAASLQTTSTLVRMFIWAIPILGFLGTVIGIAMALGRLAPQQLEESLPEVMAALTVAFNTTILALALCLILYFALYLVERGEGALLARVDQTVEEVLAYFRQNRAVSPDSGTLPTGLASGEHLLALLQAPLATWELAVQEFVTSVRQLATDLSTSLSHALAKTLEEALSNHAARLLAVEQKALEEHREHLEELYHLYQKRVDQMVEVERSVEERTETLLRALEGAETLRSLQESLQRNLAVLATSRQFEQLIMSLTAAIHLLTTRIESPPATTSTPEMLPVHVHGLRQAG